LRSKILEGPQDIPTNNHIDSIRQTLTKLIQKYQNKYSILLHFLETKIPNLSLLFFLMITLDNFRKSSSDPLQYESELEIVREASEALSILGSETSKPQTESIISQSLFYHILNVFLFQEE
jgi:cell shape-determining protein MreC